MQTTRAVHVPGPSQIAGCRRHAQYMYQAQHRRYLFVFVFLFCFFRPASGTGGKDGAGPGTAGGNDAASSEQGAQQECSACGKQLAGTVDNYQDALTHTHAHHQLLSTQASCDIFLFYFLDHQGPRGAAARP